MINPKNQEYKLKVDRIKDSKTKGIKFNKIKT